MAQMGSLGGGLAEGFQSQERIDIAKREEAFNEGIKQQESDRQGQELGIKQDEETRGKAKDALAYAQSQKDELSRQIYQTMQSGDQTQLPAFRQRLGELNNISQEAARHLVGQQLHDYTSSIQTTLGDLESGKRKFSELSPEEATGVFSHLGQGPASNFVDTPDQQGLVGKQKDAWQEAIKKMPQDGGVALAASANDRLKGEFDGLVGQPTGDGGKVTGVTILPPVPHPKNPAMLVPTLHLKTINPDGSPGEKIIPLTVDHGQILASHDPNSQALVQQFHIDQIFNHLSTIDALHSVVNADPAVRDKLMQGFLEGHEDKAAEYTDMIHILGHNPGDYLPKQQIVQLPDGSVKLLAPNEEYKEAHDYGALRDAQAQTADARVQAAQASADRAAAAAGNQGKFIPYGMGKDKDGNDVPLVMDAHTGEVSPRPIGGLAGPIAASPDKAKPPPKADKPTTKDELGPDGKKTGRTLQWDPDKKKWDPIEIGKPDASSNAAVNDARSIYIKK